MTPPTSGTGQSDQLAGTATVVDAVHKAIDGVGKALGSATQVTSKSLESIAREALPAILEDWGFSDLELLFKALRDGSAYDFNLASLHAVGRDPAATAALWTLCKQLGGEGAVWMFVTALSHQFGTKAAHLILQKLILEEAPRDLHPSVPKFVAVPHKAVAAFLEQHLPGWSDLPIQSLGQEVEKVFEAHPEECVHRCGLSGIMSKAREKNGSLMVRSTGMEDSKQMSNAGGNESVVDVKPEAASVARAIGKVIASYMSEDSLAQRRLLGNVQEKSPFVPVLVQTMFGESESAGAEEIPVGGAFFTQEAQGPTPGLVVIQATYGHGEGVMMGKGPSDSYYLLDGQRYSAVSSKRYRLVPGGGRLVPEMNEPEVWDRPALSPAVLAHFEKLCRHFERVYGCPMDGEFVWDPVKQRLHIVQVRPIVMRPAQGSYVDLQQAKKLQRVRMKECVVSAGGGVVTVEKPAQIVFAKTLLQALQDLKSRPKGTVRAAVVESSCKILEHGASVFREAQIPLLVGSKVEIPNKHQLLVDPQRCSLWVVHEHLETMRSLAEWFGQPWTEPEIIRKGTIRHPIAAVLSSMATHGSRTIAQVLGEGEQNRLLAGRTWRPDPDGPLESLLDAIGDAEQPEQLRAAYAFLSYALARRMEALKKAGASHRIQVSFRTTWQQIETLGAQGILYAQGAAAHADKRIPLMASWVSALLTQEGTSTLGRSIAQVLRSHREPPLATPEQMNEIQKVWEAEKMDHRLEEVGRVLMALQTVIFDPDLKDRWPQIVRALLLSGPVGSSDVLEAVSALQELDLLTSWINGPCAEKLRSMTTASAAEALTDVMGAMMSWDLDIRELQSDSSALRLQMATGWQELSSWEKLEGFEGRWIEFRELVLDRVKKYVSLLRGLEGETRKIQAARLLAQAIDLTDAVIKMVQGAPGIPIEERRRRVCCMVRNFTMLSMLVVEVVMDVPKEETLPVTRTFWEYEHGGRTLSYFSIWTNAVRALADEAQLGKWREDHHGFLQPGKLIVSGAIFTAGTRPSRHIGGVTDIKANQNEQEEFWPLCLTTKDDEITLSHQNGMAACWLVDTWLLSVTKALPIESVLLIKGLAGAQVRRISFEGRRVKTELSLPLRNHAASVMILQDPSSPVIHVELSLVGHNLNSRWERCGRLLKGTYPTLTWEIEKRVGSPQTPEPESASQLFRAVLELNCGSLDDSGRLGKDLSSALNATNGGLSPVLLGRSIAAQSLGAIVRLLAWRMTQVDVNQFAWKADIRELFRGNEGNLSAEEHVEALRFLKQPWMSGMQTDSAVEQRRKVLLDDLWEDPDWLLSVASKSPRNLLLGNRTGFLDRRAPPSNLDTIWARLEPLIAILCQGIAEGTMDLMGLPPLFQYHPMLALEQVKRKAADFIHLPPPIRELPEVAFAALMQCPELEEHVSEWCFLLNPQWGHLIVEALQAHPEWIENPSYAIAQIISKCFECAETEAYVEAQVSRAAVWVGSSPFSSPTLALEHMKRKGADFVRLPPSLQESPEIAFAAIMQHPEIQKHVPEKCFSDSRWGPLLVGAYKAHPGRPDDMPGGVSQLFWKCFESDEIAKDVIDQVPRALMFVGAKRLSDLLWAPVIVKALRSDPAWFNGGGFHARIAVDRCLESLEMALAVVSQVPYVLQWVEREALSDRRWGAALAEALTLYGESVAEAIRMDPTWYDRVWRIRSVWEKDALRERILVVDWALEIVGLEPRALQWVDEHCLSDPRWGPVLVNLFQYDEHKWFREPDSVSCMKNVKRCLKSPEIALHVVEEVPVALSYVPEICFTDLRWAPAIVKMIQRGFVGPISGTARHRAVSASLQSLDMALEIVRQVPKALELVPTKHLSDPRWDPVVEKILHDDPKALDDLSESARATLAVQRGSLTDAVALIKDKPWALQWAQCAQRGQELTDAVALIKDKPWALQWAQCAQRGQEKWSAAVVEALRSDHVWFDRVPEAVRGNLNGFMTSTDHALQAVALEPRTLAWVHTSCFTDPRWGPALVTMFQSGEEVKWMFASARGQLNHCLASQEVASYVVIREPRALEWVDLDFFESPGWERVVLSAIQSDPTWLDRIPDDLMFFGWLHSADLALEAFALEPRILEHVTDSCLTDPRWVPALMKVLRSTPEIMEQMSHNSKCNARSVFSEDVAVACAAQNPRVLAFLPDWELILDLKWGPALVDAVQGNPDWFDQLPDTVRPHLYGCVKSKDLALKVVALESRAFEWVDSRCLSGEEWVPLLLQLFHTDPKWFDRLPDEIKDKVHVALFQSTEQALEMVAQEPGLLAWADDDRLRDPRWGAMFNEAIRSDPKWLSSLPDRARSNVEMGLLWWVDGDPRNLLELGPTVSLMDHWDFRTIVGSAVMRALQSNPEVHARWTNYLLDELSADLPLLTSDCFGSNELSSWVVKELSDRFSKGFSRIHYARFIYGLREELKNHLPADSEQAAEAIAIQWARKLLEKRGRRDNIATVAMKRALCRTMELPASTLVARS